MISSTNLDWCKIHKTKYRYKQEPHEKPKQPCKKTTNICIN